MALKHMLTDSGVSWRWVLRRAAWQKEAELQHNVAGGVTASREGHVALSTQVLAIQLQLPLPSRKRNDMFNVWGYWARERQEQKTQKIPASPPGWKHLPASWSHHELPRLGTLCRRHLRLQKKVDISPPSSRKQ